MQFRQTFGQFERRLELITLGLSAEVESQQITNLSREIAHIAVEADDVISEELFDGCAVTLFLCSIKIRVGSIWALTPQGRLKKTHARSQPGGERNAKSLGYQKEEGRSKKW